MPMQQFRPTILNLLLSTALHLVLPPKQPNPWYFSCCTSQTSECTANVSQHNMCLQTDLFDNKCKDLPGTSGNKTLDFWFLCDALKEAILVAMFGNQNWFYSERQRHPWRKCVSIFQTQHWGMVWKTGSSADHGGVAWLDLQGSYMIYACHLYHCTSVYDLWRANFVVFL